MNLFVSCASCVRLATLQGSLKPKVDGARLLLFAADHGITKTVPAVSAYPRTVTPAMFGAIARGQAASTVLAAANGCGVVLTDVGVDADISIVGAAEQRLPTTVLHRKVSCATGLSTSETLIAASSCSTRAWLQLACHCDGSFRG
jgi:NaMN:DMB phosphoribosyltransferase